ncbi:MAG: peptidoglycan bridge formation glycyltransferase FemA/FemB family protein [Oscillospiraceae bacterium]|nr:peptidoglycan bridge formation glycyltransferase FemA/FemB family protein [Oscillospiraceae bacterium]
MIEIVTRDNLSEYEAFVESHPHGTFLQSYNWGRQKSSWRWKGILRRNEFGRITGSAAVLIRKTPVLGFSVVYGCRGPVCDPSDHQTLRELLGAIAKIAAKEHAYLVRLDPAVEAGTPDFAAELTRAGYAVRKRRRTYVPLQHRRSWLVPLAGRTEEDIFAGFEEEHRHGVRVALQRGVEVRTGGRELIPDFFSLMQQQSLRESRVVRPMEYYASLLENYDGRATLSVAYHEDKPVSAILSIYHGVRCSCVFEADNADHALRAPYLLRTVVLQQAAADGCAVCEFFGLPRNPESAAYAFAQGFGGEPLTYVGELDLVRRKVINFLADIGGELMRRLNRRLYFIRIR